MSEWVYDYLVMPNWIQFFNVQYKLLLKGWSQIEVVKVCIVYVTPRHNRLVMTGPRSIAPDVFQTEACLCVPGSLRPGFIESRVLCVCNFYATFVSNFLQVCCNFLGVCCNFLCVATFFFGNFLATFFTTFFLQQKIAKKLQKLAKQVAKKLQKTVASKLQQSCKKKSCIKVANTYNLGPNDM